MGQEFVSEKGTDRTSVGGQAEEQKKRGSSVGLRDAEGIRAKAAFRVFADSVPTQDICTCLQPAAYIGTVEIERGGASSDHQEQAGSLFPDIEVFSLPEYGVKSPDEG